MVVDSSVEEGLGDQATCSFRFFEFKILRPQKLK